MVLLGEMRHCVRIRFTFTRPYLGTARSRSNTLAVASHSGGSRSSPWIWVRPALRSRLSRARCVRISFARFRASMRWVRERSGAVPSDDFAGVWAAGGMARDSTHAAALVKASRAFFRAIHLDLK